MTLPPNRRDVLKVGALGAGLSLSRYLQLEAAGQLVKQNARSGILVFLTGGPSHQDTFDLKPKAPREYRGEFQPIATNASGVEICEHLPKLAKQAQHFTIVRGISHNLAAHGLGVRYLMTGNRPTPVLRYPEFGSVASREQKSSRDMPTFVSINRELVGPGYLGAQYGALATGEKPRPRQPFRVRGITLDDGLTLKKFRSRRQLLADLDTTFAGCERLHDEVRGLDEFSKRAFHIISSPKARRAFDLEQEPAASARQFGEHEIGLSLLLAARLIEAGVRFVTVLVDNWDTHQKNFTALKTRLLPPFDRALSALLQRLSESGRLKETAVMVTGEFGRTPKVNGRSGRDHWARAMCALLAGGAVKGGQVIGATDAKATQPEGTGFSPDDLAATFYKNLGIDPKTEYQADVGRPITLVRDGAIIKNALS